MPLPAPAYTSIQRALVAVSDANLCERLIARLPQRVEAVRASPDGVRAALDSRESGTAIFALLDDADALLGSSDCERSRPAAAAYIGDDDSIRMMPLICLLRDSQPPAQFFPIVHRRQIRFFFHPAYLEEEWALPLILDIAAQAPGYQSLAAYCRSAEPVRTRRVRTPQDMHDLIDRIADIVRSRFGDDYDPSQHRLALEEALCNAFFHGFLAPEALPKSHAASFERLSKDDEIRVEYVVDDNLFAFSVADKAGRLNDEEVRRGIHRQLSGEALHENRGRGVFLTYALSNVFLLNHIPKRLSQVVVAFFRGQPPEHKIYYA
ncbi:MAG: ATP-binding protein [Candidatus Sumerlaeota bacterium]|nr:ATP-binding protein [Candidatus Sumerlaeota bacterium]